ncbi:MAG: hypothetical protein IKR48_10360 [Kiritimatiellae bacterium]|nr:hypothetical protein [Kiritimatiellia bacterium]
MKENPPVSFVQCGMLRVVCCMSSVAIDCYRMQSNGRDALRRVRRVMTAPSSSKPTGFAITLLQNP